MLTPQQEERLACLNGLITDLGNRIQKDVEHIAELHNFRIKLLRENDDVEIST